MYGGVAKVRASQECVIASPSFNTLIGGAGGGGLGWYTSNTGGKIKPGGGGR